MAPEQVRGLDTDARSDLFALGAVLYEMLSGRRAFQGETAADTMFALVKEDPPELTATRRDLSPALDRVVRHCLEKNPNERFQTARDVGFALQALSETSPSAGHALGRPVATSRRWLRIAGLALLASAAFVAGAAIGRVGRPSVSAVKFEAKTWDDQWITNARFAPDGETIVFSAAPSGNLPRLFVVRPGTLTVQPLGESATQLLSISSRGELAVLTSVRPSPAGHRVFQGTLARMTMDGAPRPWLENVSEADWSPDGSTLAIIRWQDAGIQLEYPIGHVLFRKTGGYLSDLRVSPDGNRIAFFDHQILGDNRGWVKVVDRNGSVNTLAGEYWGEEGVAWAPDGRSVFYTAGKDGGTLQPFVVNATGTPIVRQAVPIAGWMYVLDAARDGRLLMMRNDLRYSIRAFLPGEPEEREFPWLDSAVVGYLSRDKKFLLFSDQSQSAGPDYAVALRDLNRGTVVRLGEGMVGPLSPDGRWAAAMISSTGDFVLYPTGAGEAVKLARGSIEQYHTTVTQNLQWFPDGRRVFFCGKEQTKTSRCYEQDISGKLPRPVTPEGIIFALLADDGRTVLAKTTDGSFQLLTLHEDAGAPAKGFSPEDNPVAWTSDSRAVIVAISGVPTRVVRVDPSPARAPRSDS